MRVGTLAGLLSAIAGVTAGLYFSLAPVLQVLLSGQVSGQAAGIQFAIIATITGLTCAALGVIYHRYHSPEPSC